MNLGAGKATSGSDAAAQAEQQDKGSMSKYSHPAKVS
jgi:hypothetical protein